jgi:2-oxoglutarate ferredoxin oxidoreductase subunit delta
MSGEVNPTGYHFPVLAPGCTACRACRDVCPDFCFEVFKFDAPREGAG